MNMNMNMNTNTNTNMKITLFILFILFILFPSFPSLLFAQTGGDTVKPSKSPQQITQTALTANTERDVTLPKNTTALYIFARGGDIKLSWVDGASGTTYQTIPQGHTYARKGILLSPGGEATVIHMQSATGSTVPEIEVWQ